MNPSLTAAFDAVAAIRPDVEADPVVGLVMEQALQAAWSGNVQTSYTINRAGQDVYMESIGYGTVAQPVDAVEAAAKQLGIRVERTTGRNAHITLFFKESNMKVAPPPIVKSAAKIPSSNSFGEVVVQHLPEKVVEIFTALMVENLTNGSGRIPWRAFHIRLQQEFGSSYPSYYSDAVVTAFRAAGWKIHLDEPGYNESYPAFYEVSRS